MKCVVIPKGYAIFLSRRTMRDGNERSQSAGVCGIGLANLCAGQRAFCLCALLMSLARTKGDEAKQQPSNCYVRSVLKIIHEV